MNRHTHAEFYARTDLKDLLEAIDAASGAVVDQMPLPQLSLYRRGFQDALRAVAAAVGVSLGSRAGQEFPVMDRYYQEIEGDDAPFAPRLLG
ncbi:MAG: hypothetical protein HUU23_13750 [Caldilineales bacterium]|nr:hypothetical protein [Caldilineales bacterium]